MVCRPHALNFLHYFVPGTLAIGIERLYQRTVVFLRVASEQARLEERSLNLSRSMWATVNLNESNGSDQSAKTFRRMASYQDAEATLRGSKRRKYERAARYPWLPIEPDPPEPK
jgi:hypothetical protein